MILQGRAYALYIHAFILVYVFAYVQMNIPVEFLHMLCVEVDNDIRIYKLIFSLSIFARLNSRYGMFIPVTRNL